MEMSWLLKESCAQERNNLWFRKDVRIWLSVPIWMKRFCTGILTLSCDHGINHGPLAIRPKSLNQGIQMSPIYTYKAGRSCSRLPYVWQGSPNKLIKYIARWWWELLQHNMFVGWERWNMHHIFKIYCCCWKSLHLLGLQMLRCSLG